MNNSNVDRQLKELRIEDMLSEAFIIIGLLSLYGNYLEKKHLKTNDNNYHEKSTSVFNFILIATLILYLIFLYRNYTNYKNATEERKEMFRIRLLGSCFFLAGIICNIFYHKNTQDSNAFFEL